MLPAFPLGSAAARAAHVRCELSGAVALVTLNDPARRNILGTDLRDELRDVLAEAGADSRVGAIVLAGEGACFSAGGDLASMPPESRKAAAERMAGVAELMRVIVQLDKPVVAAVGGPAAGVAIGVVCACDVVLASENARFLFPFTTLGLMPDGGLVHLLAQRVGAARARRLLLEAAAIGSRDALELGLVDDVVTDRDVVTSAMVRAGVLAARAPLAVAALKEGFRSASSELEDALSLERSRQPLLFDTADFLEGRKAFYEKREPRFSGR